MTQKQIALPMTESHLNISDYYRFRELGRAMFLSVVDPRRENVIWLRIFESCHLNCRNDISTSLFKPCHFTDSVMERNQRHWTFATIQKYSIEHYKIIYSIYFYLCYINKGIWPWSSNLSLIWEMIVPMSGLRVRETHDLTQCLRRTNETKSYINSFIFIFSISDTQEVSESLYDNCDFMTTL